MQNFRNACILLALNLLVQVAFAQNIPWIISAPAGDRPTQIVRGGETVIPNGRIITPRGKMITTAPHPYGLALSPDGTMAVTANTGIRPFSVTVIRNPAGDNPAVQQIPDGVNTDKGVLAAVYMGVAIAPDNKKIYVAGGQEGKVYVFDPVTRAKLAEIDCNDSTGIRPFSSSYIGDLTLSRDGQTLYAVDQMNFRLILINTGANKVERSIGVGRYPFGVALSPDQKRLYVAEAGINAVGVIDVPTQRVLGHLPTGWFPSKLQVSRDGKKLLVANAKGYGSGPNGGSTFAIGHEGSYIGNLMKGTVSVLNIPADDALPAETQQVLRNNFNIRPANDPAFAARKTNPVPLYPSAQNNSPIKHVVFVIKAMPVRRCTPGSLN